MLTPELPLVRGGDDGEIERRKAEANFNIRQTPGSFITYTNISFCEVLRLITAGAGPGTVNFLLCVISREKKRKLGTEKMEPTSHLRPPVYIYQSFHYVRIPQRFQHRATSLLSNHIQS